jgi:hypothetical protein
MRGTYGTNSCVFDYYANGCVGNMPYSCRIFSEFNVIGGVGMKITKEIFEQELGYGIPQKVYEKALDKATEELCLDTPIEQFKNNVAHYIQLYI